MDKLDLFDYCSECNQVFQEQTSVQIVGCGLREQIGNFKMIAGFGRLVPYLTVQPISSKTEYDVSCTAGEFSIFAKLNLPVIARICMHKSNILDEREAHSQIESDNDGDWAKHGIALSNMLSEHNSETDRLPEKSEEDEQKIYKKFCDLVPQSESDTVRLPEKVEETEDCVKFTWSIPQEFERIKAQAKRLKAEKKKWKRDFKALKDWTANFQQIIENAQKSLSIIGDQNQQGAKDED